MTQAAITYELAPTGEGEIVLKFVEQRIIRMIQSASNKENMPIIKPGALYLLHGDLIQRAEMGKAKYGTYLRVNNGRSAAVDTYQEICDAIMYASQARMEGDNETGTFVELLISLGAQLATIIAKR